MIQANELRIGNWIQRLDGSKFQVTTIDFEFINKLFIKPLPILLTEEILLKCGFNWIGLGGMVKDNYFIRHEGCLTMCMKSGVLLTTVHQLQNLYFALTKQELEIKL